jgi:hypothetical protein
LPNQPDETQTIDAIGAPEVVGAPEVEATFPTIADLIPAKARAWTYALLVPFNAAMTPIIVNLDGTAATVAGCVFAFVNASGFGLALSNVPKATGGK